MLWMAEMASATSVHWKFRMFLPLSEQLPTELHDLSAVVCTFMCAQYNTHQN